MIKGIGTDIIEIGRVREAIEKNDNFLGKLFTEDEIKMFKNNKVERVAGNFAGKEAISKALGTGVRGFSLKDIEILRDDLGKPYVNFKNSLIEKTENSNVNISISHCNEYATAFAVIEEI